MNEDERARQFVERHFPETSRFLAEESSGDPVPVFGPASRQNVHDDQPAPHVAVRVEFLLSRPELLAAFANGYATTNTMQDPDAMTIEEIRYDVEAHLADTSLLDLDDLVQVVARQSTGGPHAEQMQALSRALDRAYPAEAPEREREMQRPYSYSDGTVLLQTVDRGEVLITEPEWCKGHDEDAVGTLAEISHEGADTVVDVDSTDLGDVRLLSAHLTQAPYLDERPEPHPLMYVEGMEAAAYDSQRLRAAAARLVVFAGHLRDEARRLEEFEQGDQS